MACGRNADKEEISIDKDIPLPKKQYKYPFNKMEIGDSFWVEKETDAITSVVRFWSDKLNATFYTKAMPKDGKMGTRIWRTQ
jgi:hypothetical protein